MTRFFTTAAAFAAVFLAFAFIFWEINPAHWPEFDRGVCAVLACYSALCVWHLIDWEGRT
jgi:hypothetical protein